MLVASEPLVVLLGLNPPSFSSSCSSVAPGLTFRFDFARLMAFLRLVGFTAPENVDVDGSGSLIVLLTG